MQPIAKQQPTTGLALNALTIPAGNVASWLLDQYPRCKLRSEQPIASVEAPAMQRINRKKDRIQVNIDD